MELLLLRHGQPQRLNGADQTDPPLTDEGRRQAEHLAEQLAAETPDLLIASPLIRARETAEPTVRRLGASLALEPGIAEVDSDGAPYVHVEDLRAQGGEAWAAFLRDPIATLGGDETTFKTRVLDGFDRILRENKSAAKVAMFTHGFPINVLLAHSLGLTQLTKFLPAHGSITRLVGSRIDNLVVISVNETGHLPTSEGG